MSKMPRIQAVVLPILRTAFEGSTPLVTVNTWVPDIDKRSLPLIMVRRLGGFHSKRFDVLSLPVIEMTAYGTQGLAETEQLYEDALRALFLAVQNQTQTESGYLHSFKETFGATQFGSLFQDSWRIQGLIQLGLRPPRTQ
jgi:hypothetical protein